MIKPYIGFVLDFNHFLSDISGVQITFNRNNGWRSHKFIIGLGIAHILFFLFLFNQKYDSVRADWDYVSNVLLSAPDRIVWRWTTQPAVGVTSGSPKEIAAVRGAIWEVNQLLSGTTMQVHYTEDDSQSDIDFVFISRAYLEQIAATSEREGLLNTQGFWIPPDFEERGRLDSGTIIVLSSLSEGDKWGTILHELGHALGLVGHTNRYMSSLFYANIKGGAFSDRFSSDDQKALHFLYTHLEPGYDAVETRDAFDKHWDVAERPLDDAD